MRIPATNNELTTGSAVFEKKVVCHLEKKFPNSYAIQIFMSILSTRARHWTSS
jgi:hypothetical protein